MVCRESSFLELELGKVAEPVTIASFVRREAADEAELHNLENVILAYLDVFG